MGGRLIEAARSAYHYPLLIKQLLHTPLVQAPDQEIVYRDLRRLTYADLRDRIGRLANCPQEARCSPRRDRGGDGLGQQSVSGSVLRHPDDGRHPADRERQAVAGTDRVHDQPRRVRRCCWSTTSSSASCKAIKSTSSTRCRRSSSSRQPSARERRLEFAGEYEELLAAASPEYDFPDFDENAQATTFYTTGTTGLPKGVYFSHRQLVLHTLAELAAFGIAAEQGRFHRDDVYMPITPMFHVHAWGFPWAATVAGVKQVYPGRYAPDVLLKLIKTEGVTFTHGVPTILQMLLARCGAGRCRSRRLEDGDRRLGPAARRSPRRRWTGASTSSPDMACRRPARSSPRRISEASDLDGDPDRRGRNPHQGRTCRPAGRSAHRRLRDERSGPATARATGEIVVRAPWLTKGISTVPRHRSNCGPADICTPTISGTIDARRLSFRSPIASRTSSRPEGSGFLRSSSRTSSRSTAACREVRGNRRQGREMGRAAVGNHRPRPEGKYSGRPTTISRPM